MVEEELQMVDNELYELIEKIQHLQAESQEIEVKSAHNGCPKKLYDTLSAFSNQDNGGVILFGLEEEKEFQVVGVYDVQDLQKKVNEQCKQMIPIVRPVFTVYQHKDGAVVSAEIPGIDITERPCYYGGVGRMKGAYVRSGDSDEPMTDYEIYSYEAFRKKYQDDIRVNEKVTEEVIDSEKLESYIETIKERNPKLAKLPEKDIRRLLNMEVDGKMTLACTLLFSIYPQMFYPQYTVNAMVVPGYQRGDIAEDGTRFLDNRLIEGTLLEILEETLKFLRKNMKVGTYVNPITGMRGDKTEYPVVALREALLNALIHRDYSIHTEGMPIEVIMYKNRLEIRNPGGLYGRLTVDMLGKMQPDTRNPVLARAMETLGVTENRYSGIPTIQREIAEAGLKEAEFSNSRNEFVVTFYNDAKTEFPMDIAYCDEDGKIEAVLKFCRKPKSRKEIASFLKISTTYYAMQNYVMPLVEEGKLKMTIPEHPKSRNQKFYSE